MVIVLTGAPRAVAAAVAESIRKAVAARPVNTGTASVPVTCSIGVATYPEVTGSVDDCVATIAAYRAQGIDEISTYGTTPAQNAGLVAAWRDHSSGGTS